MAQKLDGDLQGSQNSLKFGLCNEEMNRTISSADFRHSVWKYRRASGFSESVLLTSCTVFRKYIPLLRDPWTYIQLHSTDEHFDGKESQLQTACPRYPLLAVTRGRS